MTNNYENEVVKYLRALLLLQIQTLTSGDEVIKPELVLSRAGLGTREIAQLLGKNAVAVAKAIQRAGKARE